jgi:hypothetical protein
VLGAVFGIAIGDLDAIGPGSTVLAEGAAALPACVASLAGMPRGAWLLPSVAFHDACYSARPWARMLVARASDAERAYRNWRARDLLIARFVRSDGRRLGLAVHEVHASSSLDDTISWAAEALGLARAAG